MNSIRQRSEMVMIKNETYIHNSEKIKKIKKVAIQRIVLIFVMIYLCIMTAQL